MRWLRWKQEMEDDAKHDLKLAVEYLKSRKGVYLCMDSDGSTTNDHLAAYPRFRHPLQRYNSSQRKQKPIARRSRRPKTS